MTTRLPEWRGAMVAAPGVTGMVLGEPVDGVATVFDTTTCLSYRVGVEALTVISDEHQH